MKNAQPGLNAELSAPVEGGPIIAVGTYPSKADSVSAEVLARMLNFERLTSLEAVNAASTTRLSAVVHYLAKEYGWRIEVTDKATGCKDGRVSWVAEYWLRNEAVSRAMAGGAAKWCNDVRAARTALKAKAAEARRKAERLNAARKPCPDPEQWGLFADLEVNYG